jgi:hypothetical protein
VAQQEEWFGIDDARRARETEQTRNGYKSGLSQIRKAKNKFRALMKMEVSICTELLAFLKHKVNNTDVGAGTLSGYRSAIKNYYKDERVPILSGYGDDLQEIFSGFK